MRTRNRSVATDPVTWEMRHDVFKRDIIWMWEQLQAQGMSHETIVAMMSGGWCVAPFLDQSQLGKCSGKPTLDHVKDQPRMGKRAPSDLAHLVMICEHHHLWSGWATSHRPLLREYLKEVNR